MKLGKQTIVESIFVLTLLIVLDLWTKFLISTSFRLYEVKPIIQGFLNLTLVHNTGAAFSIGTKLGTPFFVIASVIAIGLIVSMFWKLEPTQPLSRWALIFILSGAIGNLVDRIRLGYVVDFIQVFHKQWYWPSFNVADSAITVGVALFVFEMLFVKKNPEAIGA